MNELDQESAPSAEEPVGHHRSARERQRQGPMWGCLRTLFFLFAGVFLLLFLTTGGGWWYVGSTNFAELVRLRIEKTLEARLGREVTIGSVEIVRSRPRKVIIKDLRIANAPGGVNRYFATVRQVEITGGVESFWRRQLNIGQIDIRDPQLFFEVFPDGAEVAHNFPKWKSGPPSRYEIVRVKFGKMHIANGAFSFNDRKHEITAVAMRIASTLTITSAENLYEGIMTSPLVRIRLQDFEPVDVDMRGGFRYTPGILALRSIALKGRGIEAFVAGKLDPLTEGAYDLRLTSRLTLERVREIFRIDKTLAGTISLDTTLRGKQGDFVLAGGWVSPDLKADVYELGDVKGTMRVTNDRLTVDVARARYGGGSISADYALANYAEPYPMTVDLRYDRISIEKLFSDWGVDDTGLRGAATGRLKYGWNKDQILEGRGTGTAKLTRNTVAFSQARYPIPLSGNTNFAIDRGVITFRGAELQTEASQIVASGSLKIEGLVTDLALTVRSSDFSELDRLAFNFARAADKRDYELLGLGGSGTITGTVRGPIEKPQVVARVEGTAVQYSNVLLGSADIALRYDGVKSVLIFDRAVFADGNGRLALTGSIGFPEQGPGPQFDIAVEANGYPAQRAIDAVGLDFRIGEGLATGNLVVAGTPDLGRVTFAGLTVRRADAELKLAGDVRWLPGGKDAQFDLDIAARDFPVTDIITFLDLGTFPITGQLTGDLRLTGEKTRLEGKGSVVIRRGSIYDEPIDLASADIEFTQGKMIARNALIQSPAGEISGEAEVDFATERFSYTIASSSIDLSKIGLLASIRDLLGGNVRISSTGAGTFEQPELVAEATLNDATIRGLSLPAGSPPPSLYVAIRNGRLIVRGSVADLVTIEGDGAAGENLAVDGTVRVSVPDVSRLVAISPATASLPASGALVLDVRLGGQLTPLEALVLDITAPTFDLRLADHAFVPAQPLHLALRGGRLAFESFVLQGPESTFTISGTAGVTGARELDLHVRGRVDAALLQLAVADVRADGIIDVNAAVTGTLAVPVLLGRAEFQDAEIKFAGFPQLIDEINGVLLLSGERIGIESIRATVGGGTVVLGGGIDLNAGRPTRARITIQGSDVAVRYYEGLVVEGDFDLLLTTDMERAMLQGDVSVSRALYFRDFDLQQSLLNVILARRGITPITTASWQEAIGLQLTVNAAAGTLAVRNNIAEVTGSADLEVTGTVANPVIIGEVVLAEGGTVTIQNVDYQLVRGTIDFQNPFRIDPFFDITLEGTASGNFSEIESGPIAVTINLTGTLDRMTPTITSDPPASDITLFSILGFGGLTGGGTGQSPGASVVGQSLLYQSLFSALGSRVLPFVDSFAYDPGLLETGGAGPRVTFEKRLSRSVRFLLVYNLDNEESRQVVEWLVNRDWTLQLTRDETDEYRLDARFRRRYGAYWSIGGSDEETRLASFGELTPAGDVAAAPATRPPAVTPVEHRAFDGRAVTNVVFRADANVDTSTLGDQVAVKAGEPLAIRAVQSSIKNLFATGNFRDVRVDASETAEGLTVTFSLFLHYRVGDVDVEGVPDGDRTRINREVRVRPADVLSLNAVDDSAVGIQQALANRGFLRAAVDPETSFDRTRSIADVTFHVTPGPLAHIGQITIEGDLGPFTPAQLIDTMRRKSGAVFRLSEARGDADRMANFLVRRDHRRADVDFVSHTHDPETDLVSLIYRANVGPKVKIEVVGVSRRSVRRMLPFRDDDQAYSEDVVDRAADEIISSLQERGHFNASVDTESALENDVWTTTFHVSPGPQYRLGEVAFTGNVLIPDDKLRSVVETSQRGPFRRILNTLFRRSSGVTREQLETDRESIESYYRLRGFGTATAADPVVNTHADGTLSVVFPVSEGAQTLVSAITIEGNQQVTAGELPEPQLRAGEPLNPQLLHDDVVALQTFYANRGNAEVQVTPRVDPEADGSNVRVVYTIVEGPQILVDEIVVRGNTYTDQDVILRTSELEGGEPFSYMSILEAQRQLYRLGIFQRVDIHPEQSGTAVADRDLIIEVEEGRNLTITGALGVRAQRAQANDGANFAPRIAAAASHRNLFGTGRYFGLEGVYGPEEREAFLTYREPFVSRWNVPVQLQIFQTDDSTRTGTRIRQQGTSVEATKVAGLQTRWSLRYEYKISKCVEGLICEKLNGGEDSPIIPDLPRSLLDIEISSITPTFFWDRRDDIIDPHRGFFTSASLEYAFPLQAAKAHFVKQYVQGAWYIPVSDRTVVALSGRLGLIQPIGGTSNRDVPLSERFTAGGENTHRAFPLDRLGDLCLDESGAPIEGCERTLFREDEDSPILPLGGSGMFIVNAEYRFPLFGPVGAAVFADAGNVYATSTIRFDELRYGAGVGLRYLSPVGPLRFDIGWPLERRSYDRSFSYFITLGYAF